jgi:ribonuclease E
MKDCLKHDRARIQVGRISHFGLLEMSRQRIRRACWRAPPKSARIAAAPAMRSVSSVALHLLRALEEQLDEVGGERSRGAHAARRRALSPEPQARASARSRRPLRRCDYRGVGDHAHRPAILRRSRKAVPRAASPIPTLARPGSELPCTMLSTRPTIWSKTRSIRRRVRGSRYAAENADGDEEQPNPAIKRPPPQTARTPWRTRTRAPRPTEPRPRRAWKRPKARRICRAKNSRATMQPAAEGEVTRTKNSTPAAKTSRSVAQVTRDERKRRRRGRRGGRRNRRDRFPDGEQRAENAKRQ